MPSWYAQALSVTIKQIHFTYSKHLTALKCWKLTVCTHTHTEFMPWKIYYIQICEPLKSYTGRSCFMLFLFVQFCFNVT